MRRLILCLLAAAAPASAAIDTERMLAGRATGPAVNCIRQRDVVGQTLVNQSVIVFEMRGHKYYRNDVAPACAALRSDRAIITREVVGGICKNEIFQVFDPLAQIGYGACAFGPFTPYELPPKNNSTISLVSEPNLDISDKSIDQNGVSIRCSIIITAATASENGRCSFAGWGATATAGRAAGRAAARGGCSSTATFAS